MMSIEDRVAAVTVRVLVPVLVDSAAVIVDVPGAATLVARPEVEMVAVAGVPLVQLTLEVISETERSE